MKSQLNSMLFIWEEASKDAASLCATSTKELSRDIATVRRNTHTRGLGFFSLDLPSLDGLLTSLLEEGSVLFSGPLTRRRDQTDVRPRFLWTLWSRICDASGCLYAEPCIDSIAALRQLACLWKKISVECSADRTKVTVNDYIKTDASLPLPKLDWADDRLPDHTRCDFTSGFLRIDVPLFSEDNGIPGGHREDAALLRRLDSVARILVSELGYFDSMSSNEPLNGVFKHGPGAVSNLKSKAYKYAFDEWSDKLEGVFPYDWCTGAPLGSYPRSRSESPSRLIAVPKTAKAPRLIAAEPVQHQWCQQKVLTWIDSAIQSSLLGRFVNLHDQTLSQRLVDQASLDKSLCTLDLSSASDRVSCRAIECLLDANRPLLEAAHAVRTRYIRDDVNFNGFIKLRKYASMGSALTFPLQCILFTCIALASAGASTREDIRRLRGKVRVFGDDIIIPTHAYESCVRLLTLLDLKVNQSKSFYKGWFRESCGKDAYKGYDVTPVKPKCATPDTLIAIHSLVDTSNNLFFKGYWRAAKAVERMIPSRFTRNVFGIRQYGDSVQGLKAFSGSSLTRTHWCEHLHYSYVKQPTIRLNVEVKTPGNSLALREHFTRPWNALNPRILGPRRMGVAKLATSRVLVLQ